MPEKRDISKAVGADSGALPGDSMAGDALGEWLDACPVAIPQALRAGIAAMLADARKGKGAAHE